MMRLAGYAGSNSSGSYWNDVPIVIADCSSGYMEFFCGDHGGSGITDTEWKMQAPTWSAAYGQDDLAWHGLWRGDWNRNGIVWYNWGCGGYFLGQHDGPAALLYTDFYASTWHGSSIQYTNIGCWRYYPRIIIYYNNNGGSGSAGPTVKDVGYGAPSLASSNYFSKTGYYFDGWSTYSSASNGSYGSGQVIGPYDWNITSQITYMNKREVGNVNNYSTYTFGYTNPTGSQSFTLYAIWKPNIYTITYNATGGTGASAAKNVTYNTTPAAVSIPTKAGYTFKGYYDSSSGGTQYYNQSGSATHSWNKASNATLYAQWEPNTYTATFNKNNGSGGTETSTVTYGVLMPSVTIPTRPGYVFAGYFDAASGGTRYYTAAGNAERAWDKSSNTTLYAQWTQNKYTVKYTTNDSNAVGAIQTQQAVYDQDFTVLDNIFHKFGYACTKWSYVDDAGDIQILTAGNKARNLTTKNEVVLVAVWDLNEYYVKFNDGLSTQYGPLPIVEEGINPDTNTNWTIGYQQKLSYDDYADDGISSEPLTSVRYSHPSFKFQYWTDEEGNKYQNEQEVQNLATPNNTKELSGVWSPFINYGVDCEANIIENKTIGGITVQKTFKASNYYPQELSDLSGIVFELYDDRECSVLLEEKTTNIDGVVLFSGVDTGRDYYVKEGSIPSRLENVMNKNNTFITVRAEQPQSYSFENELKQMSIEITKKPSQSSIDVLGNKIVNDIPPIGARFAVYASEEDAISDTNRVLFYNENNKQTNNIELTRIVEKDGIKNTTAKINGLPFQDLWIKEIVAPDYGQHEYVINETPIKITASEAIVSLNGISNSVEFVNDIKYIPTLTLNKAISEDSLNNIPQSQKNIATTLCNGIEYAIYKDKSDAKAHNNKYIQKNMIENETLSFTNLPYGIYYITEMSIPQTAQDKGLVISNEIFEVIINAQNREPVITAYNQLIPSKLILRKVDAKTRASLEGVVFDIYKDNSKKELLCETSPTDAKGIAYAQTLMLPGKYFIQERYDTMPAAYNADGLGSDTSWSGDVELVKNMTAERAFTIENSVNTETGSIELWKRSINEHASLAGAIFTIYDSNFVYFDSLTTDSNGYAKIANVPFGKYIIKETSPLLGHSITEDGSAPPEFECIVSAKNQQCKVNNGEPIVNYQGFVKIHKTSENPTLTNTYSNIYSLAGAQYLLYPIINEEASITPLPNVAIITNEQGMSEKTAVPLGKYKVVETVEPDNYSTLQEKKEYIIEVTADNENIANPLIVETLDTPVVEQLNNFTIIKKARETLAVANGAPQGNTTLKDAKFEISYTANFAFTYQDALKMNKDKCWYVKTNDNGFVSLDKDNIIEGSDELFYNSAGQAVLPAGTIIVKEIEPPVGYKLNSNSAKVYRFNGTSGKFEELFANNTMIEYDRVPTVIIDDEIYRSNISFHKVDAYDKNKKMANIPFMLTLLDTNGEAVERHLVFTDANGDFSSALGNINNVNANDKYIPGDLEHGKVDLTSFVENSRVWFSGAQNNVQVSNNGSLIYGDYELREYYTDNTIHYQELEPIRFAVRGNNGQSWIEIDGKKIYDGNITDAIGEIKNHSVHITQTELLDITSKTHVAANGSFEALESIEYADATAGEKYIFETFAFDADTKQPITKTIFDPAVGQDAVIQAGGSYTLECDSETGTVSTIVSFDGYDVENKKIGLITRVYHNGYLADTHNIDLIDEKETLWFSSMNTIAFDSDTIQHIGNSDGQINITDIVSYKNLTPGYTYTATGVLMNKDTNQPLHDKNGRNITSQTVFTPTMRTGEVNVNFSFEMEANTAFSTVVFEKIKLNDNVVALHENINDEQQTVVYPKLLTLAKDINTNMSSGNPEKDRIAIKDRVDYTNLIPNKEYEIRGMLYILDENNAKIKIPNSEAIRKFIPSTSNGNTEMIFNISSVNIKGNRILVAESIWSGDKMISNHDDTAFTEQIISYPSVKTEALDIASGSHIGNGEKNSLIVDNVYINGLKQGEIYKINGEVMTRDKQGKTYPTNIVASKTFTASSVSEKHELQFNIPAEFLSCDIVVYEKILSATEDNIFATHIQSNDEAQSIHYPKITTIALSPNGVTHVGSNIDNKIVDNVSYDNLLAGYTYEIVGMLVNKNTGEFIKEPGALEPIISSKTFEATTPSGIIEIPFEIKNVDVSGQTLVVFEQLFVVPSPNTPVISKTLSATHCDIEDINQSIYYSSIATTARDKNTGTHVGSSTTESVIIDTVSYKNFVPGLEYEVKGTLYDKQTGQPLMIDDNGINSVVSAQAIFVPQEKDGSIDVVFEALTPNIIINKEFVVYEKIMLGEFEISQHQDINDVQQSVSYPKIKTQARDAQTGLHEGYIEYVDNNNETYEDVVMIKDVVEYENLVPGQTYKIEGKLVDKYEFTKIKDELEISLSALNNINNSKMFDNIDALIENGIDDIDSITLPPINEIETDIKTVYAPDERTAVANAETFFIPATSTGTAEVSFMVKKKDAYGKVFVAFEKVRDVNGNEIANHEDIDDIEQTVSYPKITTIAKDNKTNTRLGNNQGVSIVDIIRYEGLLEGHEYIASGIVMDKNTSKTVLDKNNAIIVGETTFVADKNGKGKTSVIFEADINKEALAGKTFVIFEEIKDASILKNSNQASDVDKVLTDDEKLLSKLNGLANTNNIDNINTEKNINSTNTPTENPNINSNKNTVIASHKDIEDIRQSIQYPKITTFAHAEDGLKVIPYETNSKIIDTITYENLIPGIEYKLDGIVMNRQQNNAMLSNNNTIEATKTFTPKEEKGTVDVEFNIDVVNAQKATAVMFETLSINEVIVAEHKDIDDEKQTVCWNNLAEDPNSNDLLKEMFLPLADLPSTADGIMKLFMLVSLTIVIAFGTMYWRKRRL